MSLSSRSAPGPNAGFGYQFERALHWLAQSRAGFRVGIETDDDVAVRGPDASQILEQDKHSIQEDGAPFGDRSKDLWNTLGMWMDAIEDGQASTDSAVFLMVTNKVLPDCIAQTISRAQTDGDIEACVALLEKAAKNPPEKIANLVERVLRLTSRSTLRSLIRKCELVDGSQQSSGAELREQTIACLQLPTWCASHADSIVDELSGWMFKIALQTWRQKKSAWIQRDEFVNQLHAIIERRRRNISRERAEHLIPITEKDVGTEKVRPFVKQLHLITDDDALVDGSIREFIRCNIEKSRLSAQGDVTDDDWKAFESALLSRWEKIRARVIRMRRGGEEGDIGFEIFTETTEEHREKLAGSDTEQVYLTSGTYHRLADMIRVGWHPRFEQLMQELRNKP